LTQASARFVILMLAGVYIVLAGIAEGARHVGLMDPITANEVLQKITTLASLSVGSVIGFYLATEKRHS